MTNLEVGDIVHWTENDPSHHTLSSVANTDLIVSEIHPNDPLLFKIEGIHNPYSDDGYWQFCYPFLFVKKKPNTQPTTAPVKKWYSGY